MPSFDERSRRFGVRPKIGTVDRKAKRWMAARQRVDQGAEGACVGFGWVNELLASPNRVHMYNAQQTARDIYHEAQRIDEWPGEDYEGTSVLAGAKVVAGRGLMSEYRWAFGIDDVIDTLVTLGPVVLGINWYESMYETRPSGRVEVSGWNVGGHCITATGYDPSVRLPGESRFEAVRWRNSWGAGYGDTGDGWISVEDLERLLNENGEGCVPIVRHDHS